MSPERRAGRAAFLKGRPYSHNPHARESAAHLLWSMGHNEERAAYLFAASKCRECVYRDVARAVDHPLGRTEK